MVASTSLFTESRPYCAAITSWPSARSAGISFWKHEPSAQMPWQKTMAGLRGVFIFVAPSGGESRWVSARGKRCGGIDQLLLAQLVPEVDGHGLGKGGVVLRDALGLACAR